MSLPTTPPGGPTTYRHGHLQTGTTSTPLDPPARAFMTLVQTGAVTVTTSYGDTVVLPAGTPEGTVVPLEITNIQLATGTDSVLLLY